ncbi:hypothetical protein FRC17_002632 [Serendipita sp. 399]|nr:hypothetical protein FRC17_002632 [Serendipita sp. 399]
MSASPVREGSPNLVIRSIKDPIYDFIYVEPFFGQFIDTLVQLPALPQPGRQFQRLRNIKQLGTAYYVWPGSSHNRFEHCLGVMHLAKVMVEHLSRQSNLDITPRDRRCVQLAGLLHDLGHGPFSHVFDGQFIPRARPGYDWKHEDASELMFEAMLAENDIDLPKKDIEFVRDLIAGKDRHPQNQEKPYLFEIVANKQNGIDVDNRPPVYTHHAAKAIEYMVVDAMLAADSYLKISEQVDDPQRYVFLTDSILEEIERSTQPELEKAREIVLRLRTRSLYKCVDMLYLHPEEEEKIKSLVTSERVAQAANRIRTHELNMLQSREVLPDDIIVDSTFVHFGMGDRNPIDLVLFYGKHNPNKATHARPEDYSRTFPTRFAEVNLRIFTRDRRWDSSMALPSFRADGKSNSLYGLVQAGFRSIIKHTPLRFEQEASRNVSVATTPAQSTTGLPNETVTGSGGGRLYEGNPFTLVAPSFAGSTGSPKPNSRRTLRPHTSQSSLSSGTSPALGLGDSNTGLLLTSLGTSPVGQGKRERETEKGDDGASKKVRRE